MSRTLPPVGAASPVAFPPIERAQLENGVSVWTIGRRADPIVSGLLLLPGGASQDPADRHGLAGLTADMLDEGAGGRDAMALADAIARLGTALSIDVGPDALGLSFTALERCLEPVLAIVADLVARPHLADPDLRRVRELRQHRLRQLSATASALADRAFLTAVHGAHPYGHGALGTTAALEATTIDEVRAFHASMIRPAGATFVAVGDVTHARVVAAVQAAFGAWRDPGHPAAPEAPPSPAPAGEGRIVFVDRPGAPQAELRIGHAGPPRATPDYHALVALNALLGGQFTSRLNVNLRETRGVTYGVRTAFDFRRVAGTFGCEASVQADAAAVSTEEVLREFDAVGGEGAIAPEELARGQAALTRGYVRQFETAEQLLRAAGQLATFGLEDGTFDRFVPAIEGLTPALVEAAARRHIHAAVSAIVVVGDAATTVPSLEAIGRPIGLATPEF